MSEKITFRELIESIAEETNNSKQFTHDFIKDFVDVINGGLEDDGKVNIAGFGKFKLRRMDERQGYNPQTQEKMTIPAHNKIVFKPYKDLRELVNAPYSHMEATLIEKEYKDKKEGDAVREDTDTQQDDFIPTAPPTSHQSTDDFSDEEAPFDLDDEQDNAELLSSSLDQTEENQNEKDSFSLDEERLAMDQDDDIVEFNADRESQAGKKEKSKEENYLDEFVSPIEPTKADKTETADEQTDEGGSEDITTENEKTTTFDETDKSSDQEVMDDLSEEKDTEQHEDPFALDFDSKTDEKEKDNEPVPAPSFESKRPSRNKTSKLPVIAAAAVILLIVAAGAWYFSTDTASNNSSQMAVSESKSTAKVAAKNNSDQQLQPADNQTTSAATQRPQNQPAKPTTADPASSTNPQKPSTTDMQIEDGETLWSIAEERYGNPRLWPWIYGTDGSLQNPDMILAGKSLTVPLPSGSQNVLNSADSVYVAKGFISTYRWYKNNESSKARDHLWAAKSYHEDIRNITDIQIDKADLVYAKRAR